MPKIEKILVPIDFSEHSRDAFRVAASLRKEFGAQLSLLHVFDVSQLLGLGWSLYGESLEGEILARMQHDAEAALNKFLDDIGFQNEDIKLITTRGKPFVEIIRTARDEEADMIVMGTHGRRGLKLLFMGSNAEKVVRKAPCSVMTVRHNEADPVEPFPPKKILVPTDFSLTSERSMTTAVILAAKYECKIILLHVLSELRVEDALHWIDYTSVTKSEEEIEEEIRNRAFRELDNFIEKFRSYDVKIEPMVVEDRPDEGITHVAENENASLIVMGTHGRTGISHLLMGSTAEKVVRSSRCPVLTIKPKNYVFEMP